MMHEVYSARVRGVDFITKDMATFDLEVSPDNGGGHMTFAVKAHSTDANLLIEEMRLQRNLIITIQTGDDND